MKKLFLFTCFVFHLLNCFSQNYDGEIEKTSNESENEESYKPISLSFQTKTMHLWRAFRVTDNFMTATTLSWSSRNGKWSAGFWGGYSLGRTSGVSDNSNYTELDHFIQFSDKGFTIAIWDINNFTNYDTDYYNTNSRFYDYSRQSSRFVDVTLAYQFQNENFPLKISSSTIVLGRDYYIEETDQNNLKGRFSTYLEVGFPVFRDQSGGTLYLAAGGAFALDNRDGQNDNFYASKAGLVNVNMDYSRTINVFSHQMPVSAMPYYNPSGKIAGLQLAITLF
ncbi:hypothetical protein Belba_2480 [Belliella baltica DSM 15883]|uniref:Uncharacterized protein n=1 Tax=Belliella baltica (strain DSM 15883 / CIP 108006 / LMG 21964 / BA134) TaxID=866536 RepID=I3Z717_BELBD|nr:hypothetical protein [Belliella baltica]AFL85035.1 hypothetical protein Belba_2480 [Belliella baltica DSM 15883]